MEKQTDKGILKYRMPNMLEAYDIIDAISINDGSPTILKQKRNVIKAMGPLIDCSSVGKTYDEILGDPECFMESISSIADEIIIKTMDIFKKKTTSMTQSQPLDSNSKKKISKS
jgi:hypothetical protein